MGRARLAILALLLAAACTGNAPLPTLSSVEGQQTAVVLTQASPPIGFQGAVAFPLIDAHLSDKPAWDATIQITFDGTFAAQASGDAATGTLEAQIFHDELNSARRVLFHAEGSAFGVSTARDLEAVRLGNDYYLVTQGTCGKVSDTPSRQIADLTPSSLLGGVAHAVLTPGSRQELNGMPTWAYTFTPGDVTVPLAHPAANGTVTVAAGSLWIAPSVNAAARFTLTINVKNVTLLNASQAVTGQLRETYTLNTVGTLHNISIPNGC
jgi:hypothetical protein